MEHPPGVSLNLRGGVRKLSAFLVLPTKGNQHRMVHLLYIVTPKTLCGAKPFSILLDANRLHDVLPSQRPAPSLR